MQIAIAKNNMDNSTIGHHNNNACCEIPAVCLYRAIQLAREVPINPGVTYENDSEQHPAIKAICQWWNDMAPHPETKTAAQIHLHVRVGDSKLYLGGLEDMPPTPVDDPWRAESKNACARWGDCLLVEFGQSKAANFCSSQVVHLLNVAGLPFFSMEIDPRQAKAQDFAKRGLESLKHFPERFPSTWEQLKSSL